ncbi:MAG: hypothetical protein F9K23_02900 [Bacteroidetes bacterium]|nr:MAG: hypothetical protein F9K23_02900 [Bacteroidota bacterium]
MEGLDLGEILQIGSIASDVIKHRDNPLKFIESFFSSEEALQSYLEQIDQDIVQGFKNLVEELNEKTYLEQWSAISATLTHIHDQRKSYATLFGATYKGTDGNYYLVDDQGDTVLFIDWAIGSKDASGNRTGGVLEEMYGWLNQGEIRNQTLSSLYGIFEDAPGTNPSPSSNNQYGHNAIELLITIINAAQTFSGGPISSSYATNLQVNSLYSFQQAIYKLTTSVFFTHDAILQFLNSATGSMHGRNSAYNLMVNNFGTATTEGTVWYKFADAMAALSQGNPDQQLMKTAFNATQVPPANAQPMINSDALYGGGPDCFRWCPYNFNLSDYYQNAFISSIGFVIVPPMGSNSNNYMYVGLQGTATQVGPGLTFTPMINPVPPMYDLNAPANWVIVDPASDNYNYNGCFQLTNYNFNYVTPPAIQDTTTQIQVITGFKLGSVTNGPGEYNLAISLQFGVLDVSDPQNPTVTVPDTTYYAPEWSDQMGIQQYLSGNFIGNLGGTTVQDQQTGVLTNVTIDREANGANSINVQIFPNAYLLNMFQPANVTPIINSQTAPSN